MVTASKFPVSIAFLIFPCQKYDTRETEQFGRRKSSLVGLRGVSGRHAGTCMTWTLNRGWNWKCVVLSRGLNSRVGVEDGWTPWVARTAQDDRVISSVPGQVMAPPANFDRIVSTALTTDWLDKPAAWLSKMWEKKQKCLLVSVWDRFTSLETQDDGSDHKPVNSVPCGIQSIEHMRNY